MNIISIIIEEISKFNKTIFYDIDNIDIQRLFFHRIYSSEANKSHLKYFIGKSGHKYIIQKTINYEIFKVYDMDNIESQIKNNELSNNNIEHKAITLTPIAQATFDIKPDYFTGFEQAQSIHVDDKYRRDNIATAIIDFAEIILNKPYKPSKLLSPEMQGFVKNRFKE
jgi:hypothetical protein